MQTENHNENLGINTTMTRSRCEACKAEMPWHSHHEHVSGEEHAAAVDAARKEKTKRVSKASTSRSDEKRWICTICKTEMEMANRESHLSGKRHAKAAKEKEGVLQASKAPEFGASKPTAQVWNVQQSSAQKMRTEEDENRWTCTVCKDVMHVQGRDFHLSRAHQYKEISPVATEEQKRQFQAPTAHGSGNKWTCTACNAEIEESDRDRHLSGMRHAISTRSQSECNSNATSSSSTVEQPPSCMKVDGGLEKSNPVTIEHIRKLVQGIKVPFVEAPQPQHRVLCDNWGKGKKKMKKKQAIDQQVVLEAGTATRPQISDDSRAQESDNTAQQTIPETKPQPASPPPTYTSPLDFFFRSFDGFPYNPSKPPATSFKRLNTNIGRYHRWERNSPGSPPTWEYYMKEVWNRYQAALTSEFNLHFGGFGAENNLTAWHTLCRAIGIQPLPTSCGLCREAVKDKHVNILDLLQWARKGESGRVSIFSTVEELSEYSYENKKIYAKDQIEQGDVLKYLLRELARARPDIMHKKWEY